MKVGKEKKEKYERRYWLWVTRPKYYLDKKGHDREELDPSTGVEDLWRSWTCSKETQKGDLALLWRSKRNLNQYLAELGVKKDMGPDSDIGYLFQAESDAYSTDDEEIPSPGWSYSCEMIPVYKFLNPLTISEIKENPYLQDWNALRGKFQHSYFRISNDYWERLNQLLMDRDPGYKKVLERIERRKIPIRVDIEEQIEDQLAKNPGVLKQLGFNLDLVGRQMVCIGGEGRIDLLFQDTKKKTFVVVELKNVRAGQNTFGQISNYMGWVKEKFAKKKELVKGLVISRGKDLKFESAMRINPDILQLDIEKVGFK
ncbi:MAG: PDDEXK nuclease domain-containing protein [Deltaproteobacteria bacterium]